MSESDIVNIQLLKRHIDMIQKSLMVNLVATGDIEDSEAAGAFMSAVKAAAERKPLIAVAISMAPSMN